MIKKPKDEEKRLKSNVESEIYDICHHCKRVVPDGTLINHLKNDCLPRRKRLLEHPLNLSPHFEKNHF